MGPLAAWFQRHDDGDPQDGPELRAGAVDTPRAPPPPPIRTPCRPANVGLGTQEGHPGWRFDQIDKLLNASFATSPTPPDLITVHLGTNDCGQKLSVPTIETNAHSLLAHVFAKAPKATVYVASMIGFPHCPVCSQAFNKLVPGIVTPNDDSHATLFAHACLARRRVQVAAHKAKGMKVYYSPLAEESGVCVDKSVSQSQSGLCCSGVSRRSVWEIWLGFAVQRFQA